MNIHSLPNEQHHRAFTLIELLVVILIVIVMATFAMMGIRQFRGIADKAVATRNISQLHIANAGYATDHGGRYMPVYAFDENKAISTTWHNNTTFLSYLNGDNVTVKSSQNENTVPLGLLDPIVVRSKKHRYDTYDASFGYNNEGFSGSGTGWGNPGTIQSWFVNQVVSPERSCAFISCTDWIAKYSGRSLWKGGAAVEGKTPDGKIAYRHKGNKALVVYYDGHVGELSMKEIEKLDNHADANMKGIQNKFWNADGK